MRMFHLFIYRVLLILSMTVGMGHSSAMGSGDGNFASGTSGFTRVMKHFHQGLLNVP